MPKSITPEPAAKPTRRAAIDQALRKWEDADRAERVKIARAYLGDAVQRQSDESDRLSMRVQRGIELLAEALAHQQRCATCKGKGTVPRITESGGE